MANVIRFMVVLPIHTILCLLISFGRVDAFFLAPFFFGFVMSWQASFYIFPGSPRIKRYPIVIPNTSLSSSIQPPLLINQPETFVVYHGTSSIETAKSIVMKGFRVGDRGHYGFGFYTTTIFEEAAKTYAEGTGCVLAIHLSPDTPIHEYENIFGSSPGEKQEYSKLHNISIVFIKSENWFLFYGDIGRFIQLKGFMGLELFDCQGNKLQL